MLTVTKKFSFCYAHFLPSYKGDCSKVHGHNSNVECAFTMMPGAYNGMCVDFKDIKKIIAPIIEELDHSFLNDIITIPTAENIVLHLITKINKTLLGPYLARVRVSETDDSFAEWERDAWVGVDLAAKGAGK